MENAGCDCMDCGSLHALSTWLRCITPSGFLFGLVFCCQIAFVTTALVTVGQRYSSGPTLHKWANVTQVTQVLLLSANLSEAAFKAAARL
jgi:hypothetical protein